MSNPKFSVIIPAYNAETTLRTTVSSVLCQTDADFEIIIVDDGSTDKTLHAMLDVGCMDLRIRIVSQKNSGVSAARNFGASLAKGELLAFLDADDQWAPEKLSLHRQLHEADATIEASYAKVAFCADKNGVLVEGPSVSQLSLGSLTAEHDICDVVVQNPVCTTSNYVITREAFAASGGFAESLRYAEDQELLVRLVSAGVRMCALDKTLVKYRMSEDGLSCDFDAMLAGWRSFAIEWLDADELARAEATYCRYLARRALRAGGNITAARSFVRRGLAADRPSFMSERSRSLLIICGALAGGIMPTTMRRAVFA